MDSLIPSDHDTGPRDRQHPDIAAIDIPESYSDIRSVRVAPLATEAGIVTTVRRRPRARLPVFPQRLHQPSTVACLGGRMARLAAAVTAPDQIAYLDAAAGTEVGSQYKRRFVAALDVRPGQAVVDIGCGPGTDLASLADAVGVEGAVVGVDREARMVDEARRRLADRPNVGLRLGDIHDLPLPDGSVDRARVDRVLQHPTRRSAASWCACASGLACG